MSSFTPALAACSTSLNLRASVSRRYRFLSSFTTVNFSTGSLFFGTSFRLVRRFGSSGGGFGTVFANYALI